MHSHYAQVRGIATPPLPHQPQAHFYAVPDLDLNSQPQPGMKAGTKGYYFGFDTLPRPRLDHHSGKDHMVLAGYEGGLDVHAVGKKGLEPLQRLKGLRGGVYHAKILPWMVEGCRLYPLVALVIHGPHLPAPHPGANVDADYDPVSAERSEAMARVNSADALSRDGLVSRATPGFVDSYQTTVEVYSLKTGKLVCPLLEAPKIPLNAPITSPIFKAPPPTGAFHIRADSGTLVVSSGITGEAWIFRSLPISHANQSVQFRCLGKIWTTLQQPLKGDSTQEAERNRVPLPPRPRPQSAIMSINHRWIAYCPAVPSSPLALRAVVVVQAQGKAPGLTSVTSPQLPLVNSDLDLPLSESVMNKIVRDATQELIQGAKWVGKHGLQAWNHYWNPQANLVPRSPTLNPQGWSASGPRQDSQFPPTHGTVTASIAKEPGLISILDVETMGLSTNLHPLVTFAVPQGCSYLSFSPSGLWLFTASSKGDVQAVWDLMRLQHTKSSTLQPSAQPQGGGPRVRQLAHFSRMTVARIVDVAWTNPNGERLAMVTERGTLHLLDLPPTAFVWPPPRRRTPPQDVSAAPENNSTSAITIASNALSTVRDAARPLMNRPRRSSSNVPQPAAGGLGDYATHSGKVIAASISHSLGKTGHAISQLRHTGENRVSLPSTTAVPGPSCVVWTTGKKDHFLFVVGDGLVRTFPTRTRKSARGGQRRAPRLSRYKDFKLPFLPDDAISPAAKAFVDPDEYLDLAEEELDAGNNNTMVLDQLPCAPLYSLGAESAIPQAEIESSAPYQPFHTDRRVALFEFERPATPGHDSTDSNVQADVDSASMLLATVNLDDNLAPHEPPAPRRKQPKAKGLLPRRELLDLDDEEAQTSVPFVSPSLAPSETPVAGFPGNDGDAWAFGEPIATVQLDLGLPFLSDDETPHVSADEMRALPPSAMERVLHRDDKDDQIVVTTRRRRGAGRTGSNPGQDDDGFFEDDCEVLDFADQRV